MDSTLLWFSLFFNFPQSSNLKNLSILDLALSGVKGFVAKRSFPSLNNNNNSLFKNNTHLRKSLLKFTSLSLSLFDPFNFFREAAGEISSFFS